MDFAKGEILKVKLRLIAFATIEKPANRGRHPSAMSRPELKAEAIKPEPLSQDFTIGAFHQWFSNAS